MNSLLSRALELQRIAHELMCFGMDGTPVYSDTFCRLNKEVLVLSDSLFPVQGFGTEEEANVCLALLMGYNATIYDNGDKEQKKQIALNRACELLGRLPASLLKVRLLAYTYGEVYEESLLQEAHTIVDSWDKEAMITEQVEAVKELRNIEENPYPFEEVEE
jgi:hypothetical protein